MANITSPNYQPKAVKPSLLVVEDNADQWFLINRALQERFPEVEPVWLADPGQVIPHLDACTQNRSTLPRLILMDLYLPQRQIGYDLLQTLKVHGRYREIPVVVLSQSNALEDIRKSYTLRSNSDIVKPDTYEKWLDCIAYFRHYWWEAVTLPKFS